MKNAVLNHIEHLKAKDIMNKEVIFATNDMSAAELADLFESKDVTGVPVVDQKGKVIGVVSETDLVASEVIQEAESKEAPSYFRRGWTEGEAGPDAIDYEKESLQAERIVEDLMTPWIVSVTEEAPVTEIAQKMISERVHRILVMDPKGRLKGIISSMDLVRLLAESAKKVH